MYHKELEDTVSHLNTKKLVNGVVFILAERIEDYRTAALAQAEYWAEGFCCRKVVVDESAVPHYELWVGPKRVRKVRTLPGEVITRKKTTRMLRVV